MLYKTCFLDWNVGGPKGELNKLSTNSHNANENHRFLTDLESNIMLTKTKTNQLISLTLKFTNILKSYLILFLAKKNYLISLQ